MIEVGVGNTLDLDPNFQKYFKIRIILKFKFISELFLNLRILHEFIKNVTRAHLYTYTRAPLLMCKISTQVIDETPVRGIPICSLFRDDDMEAYGAFDGRVITNAEWDAWDRFIEVLIHGSLYVKKGRSVFPTLLAYKNGFLVLRTLFRKRVVCVKGVKCCTCIDNTIVIETEEYGHVRMTFKENCDALAVARVLSGFACGLYDNGLP